jgi:hypothetical protein
MNKTYRVIPGNYNPNGLYTITLYYTPAEKAGWETATGHPWSNIKLIKTSGAISSATPSNPGAAGNIEMVSPVHGMLGVDYTLSYTFNTGFSGFGAGIVTSTLPVGLLSFEGTPENNSVKLLWSTSRETKSRYFEVQRSIDGYNYQTIAKINSTGNSAAPQDYLYLDHQAGAVNYYRLRLTDNDGKTSLSKTVLIKIAGLPQKIYVLTNPFDNTIRLRLANQPQDHVNLQLFDMSGKLLISKVFKNAGNLIELDAPAAYLSRGIYLLKARVDSKTFVYRLIR